MFKTLYLPNPVKEYHLANVMKEMVRLDQGPMVQAIDFEGYYVALEGAHRIEAARRLGYPVCILPIARDQEIEEGSIEGLEFGRGKWLAKDLGHYLLRKRPKSMTPVYKYSEDTGYLEIKYYPTCTSADVIRIVGKTSLAWLFFIAMGSLILFY